jgi:hypothetical protein
MSLRWRMRSCSTTRSTFAPFGPAARRRGTARRPQGVAGRNATADQAQPDAVGGRSPAGGPHRGRGDDGRRGGLHEIAVVEEVSHEEPPWWNGPLWTRTAGQGTEG